MSQKSEPRRKYPRHKAPKGLFVGWKAAGQRTVSRAETIGLGGLFLHTPHPPSEGSIIELLFDLKAGEVRARAVVRHSSPGKGMGVQFTQMQAADRARLNQFLSRYTAAQSPLDTDAIRTAAASATSAGKDSSAKNPPEAIAFERDFNNHLELARKGTYYQLFSVAPDAPVKEIRQKFYALARKFHPDYHMDNTQWMVPLKELMGVATSAYKLLIDAEQRARYDARLAASGAYNLQRSKSASQETIEQCLARANECLRANNFTGSIVWLRKCTELSPEEARYHALLARSLSEVPAYRNDAIGEFERAIELDPWNPVPYIQFAELYESMQLASRARPLYMKVLEINPLHTKARERLEELSTQPVGTKL